MNNLQIVPVLLMSVFFGIRGITNLKKNEKAIACVDIFGAGVLLGLCCYHVLLYFVC